MEYLSLCCVAPHPPILIPEIGRGEIERIKDTTRALRNLQGEVAEEKPETLIVMSPHSSVLRESFGILAPKKLSGNMAQFGAPGVRISAANDLELARLIAEKAAPRGISVSGIQTASRLGGERDLDHGVMVPLYYLAPSEYMLVSIAISFMDYDDHYHFGMSIKEAVEELERKAVFIASGDLSHRLIPGAPAGYSTRGRDFDQVIVDIFKTGDYERLSKLDLILIEEAGECGLRSCFALAGVTDGYAVDSQVLSYEAPFGVGYMVASVRILGEDENRKLISRE